MQSITYMLIRMASFAILSGLGGFIFFQSISRGGVEKNLGNYMGGVIFIFDVLEKITQPPQLINNDRSLSRGGGLITHLIHLVTLFQCDIRLLVLFQQEVVYMRRHLDFVDIALIARDS